MAGLNAALEIGKNALLNAQVQIQTTSHNVANAENPNYSRQKAPTVTQGAILGRAGWIGAGARLDRIVQQRDTFLEGRSLDASSQSAYYGTLERILTAAETSLSDDGDTGLYAALNDFWTAWNTLAQNPEGAAEKAVVVECGRALCTGLNQTAAQLTQHREGIVTELRDNVSTVNELLQKIRDLNQQIQRSETPSFMANDLRDQRFQALQELSQYVRFTTQEGTGGTLNVFLEDGTPLVLFTEYAAELKITGDADALTIEISDADKTVAQFDAAADDKVSDGLHGSTGALLTALGTVQSWHDALDTFASTLVTRFKDLYEGLEIPGAFFDPESTTAAEIHLSDDPLSASSNALARAALSLESEPMESLGNLTPGQYLTQLSQDVGLSVQSASTQHLLQDSLAQQLDAQRQSVSGVSLDEEMVELIKHQQLYQAAAKLIQQTAEMIQTAINMV